MKIIRFFSVLSLSVVLSATAFSQQTIDSRLLAKYDQASLQKMQQDSPDQLDFLNYYVEHAGYLVDMPQKPIQYTDLVRLSDNSKAITSAELINFNPYLYNCKNLQDKNSYYKVGNTGKLLIMVAMKNLQNQYNNYKRMKTLKK
jgi:hypothetical protein